MMRVRRPIAILCGVGFLSRPCCRSCPSCGLSLSRPSCRRCPSRARVALGAQRVALTRALAVRSLDAHLQHVSVVGTVHAMAARAGRAAALEASGERQRLRTIEPVRPPVGPEVSLRIVLRNRLADEERQRVVLVVLARSEAE